MGILRAAGTAISMTLQDQWREFFYCDSLSNDTLLVRGTKRVSENSANTGNSDVITDGSVIAVNDGMAALVVSNGKVMAVATEPGEFVYENPDAVPLYRKGGLKSTAKQVWTRIGYGGDILPIVDRVYFINTKIVGGNPIWTDSAIPIRIVDRHVGLDIDCSLRVEGLYSYKVTKPEVMYKTLIGNVERDYSKHRINGMLKTEILSILQQTCAGISRRELRLSSITDFMPAFAEEIKLCFNYNEEQKHGISMVDISFSTFTVEAADGSMIMRAQRNGMLCDPAMAGAYLTSAQADAMKLAAENPGGGALMSRVLLPIDIRPGAVMQENAFTGWICTCGTENQGKFCVNCGEQVPEAPVT